MFNKLIEQKQIWVSHYLSINILMDLSSLSHTTMSSITVRTSHEAIKHCRLNVNYFYFTDDYFRISPQGAIFWAKTGCTGLQTVSSFEFCCNYFPFHLILTDSMRLQPKWHIFTNIWRKYNSGQVFRMAEDISVTGGSLASGMWLHKWE